MDAGCVDRPAAIVRGELGGLTETLLLELVDRGYDVHVAARAVPSDLACQGHPRLHLVHGDDVGEHQAPVASVRRGAAPLALVVCSSQDDLGDQVRVLHELMGPLRRAGVLVVGDGSGRERSPDTSRVDADPRIAVVTLAGRPARAAWRRLLRRTGHAPGAPTSTADAHAHVRRGLDALAPGPAHLTCRQEAPGPGRWSRRARPDGSRWGRPGADTRRRSRAAGT